MDNQSDDLTPEDKALLRDAIEIAIEMLKKRWELPTRMAVIERLLDQEDKTLLQIARRRVRLQNSGESSEG